TGIEGLKIRSVTLLENGIPISHDEHLGWAGSASRDNIYRLHVNTPIPGAIYSIRTEICAGSSHDSNGIIILQTP
ncbi:MAG: hypothetical protein JJU11_13505, partial [Candidatus Sumerlaeia bacterium]|nr:hypothetical protein [Candidatus Sumerlaeia bacterium]